MIETKEDKTFALIQAENAALRKRIAELEQVVAAQQAQLPQEAVDKETVHALLNAIQESAFLMDIDGTILQANACVAKRFGKHIDELIGTNAYDVVPPDVARERKKYADQVVHTRQPVRFEDRRNGHWIDNTIYPVFDRVGNVTSLAVFGLDFTLRKQAEAELRESRTRLQAIFDNASVGIGMMHADGSYIQVNERWAQMLGYTLEEIYQTTPTSIMRSDDLSESQQRLQELIRGDKNTYTIEKPFIRKDGSIFWCNLSVTAIRNDDGVLESLVGIAADITDRKEVEDVLKDANDQLMYWVTELKQRNRESSLLNEMGDLLQSSLTVEEAYDTIARYGAKLFPDQSGTLYSIDHSDSLVEAVAAWGSLPPCEHVLSPDVCWSLRRGRTYHLDSPEEGPLCQNMKKGDPNAIAFPYVCVPLMAQGKTLGMLHLRSNTGDENPERQRWVQQLATTVAEHISLALANLSLREQLRTQSIQDPLTGLYNRRYLEEALERELRRALHRHHSVGIIMIDIDHFKHFNDTYGHDGGDAMLRELGVFLRSNVRGEDIACRYGGEELLLILPGMSLDAVYKRAEQIRQDVRALHVTHKDQAIGPVSLSIGVACFPQHSTNGADLIKVADDALYQAKAQGRNRVVIGYMQTHDGTYA